MNQNALLPILGAALALLGLLFRFGNLPPQSSLNFPWTRADAEVSSNANKRFGELLWLWALWILAHWYFHLRPTMVGTLAAPLVLVIMLTLSYSAKQYVSKHGTWKVERRRAADRSYPERGGWLMIVLREVLPLTAVLLPILWVRSHYGDLPDRIPVGYTPWEGATDWRIKDQALELMRQKTRFVYLLLLIGEGALLFYRWMRNSRFNIAGRMLTLRHWYFFVFKLGWVLLLGGMNIAFCKFAAGGLSAWLYTLPGLLLLAATASAASFEAGRTEYAPPRREPGGEDKKNRPGS